MGKCYVEGGTFGDSYPSRQLSWVGNYWVGVWGNHPGDNYPGEGGAIFFAGNCPRTVYNQHGRQIFIYLFEAVIIIEKAVSVIFQNSCFSIFSGKHLCQSLLFCKYSSRLVTSAYSFKKRCSNTGAFLN